MSKLLISLPYDASTNNYVKYFPYPLELLKYKEEGDTLIDLNCEAFEKTKDAIYTLLDMHLDILNNKKFDECLVLCGNYGPDGDKYEYFEYFLNRFKHPVQLMGPYCIQEKRIKQLDANITIKEAYTDTFGVMIPKDMLDSYPKEKGKTTPRATMRVTNGCPRMCKMCPIPIIHKGHYKFENMDTSLKQVQQYYDMGVRLITFIDDNISVHQKKFIEFLRRLKALNLKGMRYISLEGFETHAFENDELCQLVKDLKFQNIKIGMENIKEDFLKKIGKYYTDHDVVVKSMENIKKYKLDVSVYFLLGLDESAEDVMDNLKFISKYKLGIRTNILRPYEGSKLYSEGFTRKLTERQLTHYSSLSYAVSWLGTGHDIDMFEDGAYEKVLETCKLVEHKENNIITFTGKVHIGFKTSKMIKVLHYLLEQKYPGIKKVSDDREKIVFQIVKNDRVDSRDLFD